MGSKCKAALESRTVFLAKDHRPDNLGKCVVSTAKYEHGFLGNICPWAARRHAPAANRAMPPQILGKEKKNRQSQQNTRQSQTKQDRPNNYKNHKNQSNNDNTMILSLDMCILIYIYIYIVIRTPILCIHVVICMWHWGIKYTRLWEKRFPVIDNRFSHQSGQDERLGQTSTGF